MKSGRPRNVLLLWTDQQRPDTIGAYGNRRIRTPHVDRLAQGGVVFDQAYCTQPVCSPSRASLLTGLYPHTHGFARNGTKVLGSQPTLAELLKPAGFDCGYIGKWDLGREHTPQRGFEDCWASVESKRKGYDEERPIPLSSHHRFVDSRGYSPPAGKRTFSDEDAALLPEEVSKPAFMAGEAVRFLEAHRDRPFFLTVSFFEPHPPYYGPFDKLYDPEQMTLPRSWYAEMEPSVPLRYRRRREAVSRDLFEGRLETDDEAGWKALKARYWGNCTLVDKYVGAILERLNDLGLAEDTIVVYTSDHGDTMGDHRLLAKETFYEGSVRVPLVVRWPGLVSRRIATPVSQIDLAPTLLGLLGHSSPAHLQGTDLLPLLRNGAQAPVEHDVVVEWNGVYGYPQPDAHPDRLDEPESIRQRLRAPDARSIRRARWKLNVHASGEHELYDLEDDPEELHNAFHDRGRQGIVGELFQRLVLWQRATGDTLVLPAPTAAPG